MSLRSVDVAPEAESAATYAPEENGAMDRPAAKPLFSSSYKPIPKFNEAQPAQGSEFRSIAALA